MSVKIGLRAVQYALNRGQAVLFRLTFTVDLILSRRADEHSDTNL